MKQQVGAAVFLLLALALLVAGWQAHPAAWGFHFYGFLPRGWWFVAAGILAALLVPQIATTSGRAVLRGVATVQRNPWLVLALSLASAAAFYLGRLRFQFLGDGQLWVDLIDQGKSFHHFEPLTSALVSGVARGINPQSPGQVAGVLSVILGGIFVVVTARLVRSLWEVSTPRVLAWCLLLLHPIALLWFGYIESYPLVHLLQAVLAWSLILAVRGRIPLFVVVLLMVLANASHILTISWWPSLALLAWWRQKRLTDATPRVGVVFAHTLGLVAAVVAGVAILWWLLKVSPTEILTRLTSARGTGSLTAQWIFSRAHLLDGINEIALLLGPALVLMVGSAVGGVRVGAFLRNPAGSVIAGLLPGPLLTLLVVPPLLGGARDWDLYATLSLPMVLWAVHMWSELVEVPSTRTQSNKKAKRPVGDPLSPAAAMVAGRSLGLALVWTVGWLAVQLNTARAAERFELLQDRRGTYGTLATAHANENLGIFYRQTNPQREHAAWVRATEADPYNPRYYINRANAALKLDRIAEAQQMFEKALERGLKEWHVYYNLGICGMQLNDPAEAEARFTQLIEGWPQEWRGWGGRGEARLRLRRPSEALHDLQRLVQLQPQQARGYRLLGRAYHAMGQVPEAQAAWRRAIQLDPNDQTARDLLAAP